MGKPIIIDGVDVTGCKLYDYGICDSEQTLNLNCDKNKNCYYKQLQRKTQECEKLKEDLNALQQTYEACEKEYKKLHKNYLHVLDMAKQSADSYEYCLRELEEQNEKSDNALKAVGEITNLLKTKRIWHSIDEVNAEFDKILEIVKQNTSNDVGKKAP